MSKSSKTLTEYINEVKKDFFNLRNVSTIKVTDGFEELVSISVDKYIDILKAKAIKVTLNDNDTKTYKYKPRLLSKVLYDTENLFYLILLLNDMTVETFIPEEILLLNRSDRELIEIIVNKEKTAGNI